MDSSSKPSINMGSRSQKIGQTGSKSVKPKDNPSSQPYDPKTNYLAPRPQYLYYKPNSRTEQYRRESEKFLDVKEGKMGNFVIYVEQPDDPSSLPYHPKTNNLAPRPRFRCYKPLIEQCHVGNEEQECSSSKSESGCEGMDESTEEAQAEEAAEKSEDSHQVSDSEIRVKHNGNHIKSQCISWFKVFPLLFFVVIACLFVRCPESPVLNSSSSAILKIFHRRESRFKSLFTDSGACLTSMASTANELSSFDLANLTFAFPNQTLDSDLVVGATELNSPLKTKTEKAIEGRISEGSKKDHQELEILAAGEEDVRLMKHTMEKDIEDDARTATEEETASGRELLKEFEEARSPSCEPDTDQEYRVEDHDPEVECKAVEEDVENETWSTKNKEEFLEEVEQEISPSSYDAAQNTDQIAEEHEDTSHDLIITPESSYTQDPQIQLVDSGDTLFEGSYKDIQISEGLESLEHSVLGSDGLSVRALLGLFAVGIVLATSIVFLCTKKKKTTVVEENGTPLGRVVSGSGSCDDFGVATSSRNQNVPMGVDEMGDSSLSEASSYLHMSPYSGKGRNKREDSLSNGRSLKQEPAESLFSCYGSFTALQKVSSKKGSTVEEVVTPVRRSSRIRKKLDPP